MKLEDVKIGMRVVPHDKTDGPYSFKDWAPFVFEIPAFFSKNGFLIVSDIRGKRIVLNTTVDGHGDFFNASDFEPYIESKKYKLGGYIQNNKIVVYVNGKKGEANYNPEDAKSGMPFNPAIGVLLTFCRATGTDTSIVDKLFKKVEDTSICDEVIRLLKINDSFIPAIKYYREQTNCSLIEAKHYIDDLKSKMQPKSVIIDGVKYVREETQC